MEDDFRLALSVLSSLSSGKLHSHPPPSGHGRHTPPWTVEALVHLCAAPRQGTTSLPVRTANVQQTKHLVATTPAGIQKVDPSDETGIPSLTGPDWCSMDRRVRIPMPECDDNSVAAVL